MDEHISLRLECQYITQNKFGETIIKLEGKTYSEINHEVTFKTEDPNNKDPFVPGKTYRVTFRLEEN
ncbi:hypothetical protein [Anabaena lutea]|uniref:hypothetical protein n=1 Tax=Anabaena lutea TaxID=212350 RepID=UPI001684F5C1|nr:hypothetical protein [Anabaena lutea]